MFTKSSDQDTLEKTRTVPQHQTLNSFLKMRKRTFSRIVLRHLKALSHNLIIYEGTAKFKHGKFKPPTPGPCSFEVVSPIESGKYFTFFSVFSNPTQASPDPQHHGKARP